MRTAKLLFWCGVAYAILLVLIRGALPPESSPRLFLVGFPLIVIAIIIARDLARRSTIPSITPGSQPHLPLKDEPVQFLSSQIRVAANASDSYFENVIRARLRELLISKVSLELGVERDTARRALSDLRRGVDLLHNEELYTILYGPIPETGSERIGVIEDAIDMIGEWKA